MKSILSKGSSAIRLMQVLLHALGHGLLLPIGVMLVLVAGCGNSAQDQGTAEGMTADAASLIREATEAAEDATSTARMFIVTTSTSEAATYESRATSERQAKDDAEATKEAIAVSDAATQQAVNDAATATANAEATAENIAQATAAFEATMAAVEQERLAMIDDVRVESPIVTGREGILTHDEDGEPEISQAGVDLHNFVVVTKFSINTSESGEQSPSFALKFRGQADEGTYLLVSQNGQWQVISEKGGVQEEILGGEVEVLNEDGWNELLLYVEDERAFFFLNNSYVSEIDLNGGADKGDISIVTGLLPATDIAGATTEFKDLTIWSMDPLPPTATPAPQPTSPPPTVSTTAPPPATTGFGRIVVENQTPDLDLEVRVWSNTDRYTFHSPPGETVVQEFPTDEYRWQVSGYGCFRDLPQLFLKDYADTVLIIVPADTSGSGHCPWALQLYMPE